MVFPPASTVGSYPRRQPRCQGELWTTDTFSHQRGPSRARKQVPGSASGPNPGSEETSFIQSVSESFNKHILKICSEPGFTPEPVGQGCLPSTALCSIGSRARDQAQPQKGVVSTTCCPKCHCQPAQAAPESAGKAGLRRARSGQAETSGEVYVDRAVPSEARCLLFEPRKGGSGGGGEETSGQARSLGRRDGGLRAPCGVSTALSASSPWPAAEDGGVTSAKWLHRQHPAHGASFLVSLGACGLVGSWPVSLQTPGGRRKQYNGFWREGGWACSHKPGFQAGHFLPPSFHFPEAQFPCFVQWAQE